MPQAIPMVIAAGVSAASASNSAAHQRRAAERARREQAEAAAAAQERLASFQEAGEYATGEIREGLDTGTLGGSFTPENFQGDPGYQFQLNQAEAAQDRMQSARGSLYSGSAIKERERLSQGLAAQNYQDAYNRWLTTQQNRYNMLSGQQQIGYGAAAGGVPIELGEGQSAAEATMGINAGRQQANAAMFGSAMNTLQGQGMAGQYYGQPTNITPARQGYNTVSY